MKPFQAAFLILLIAIWAMTAVNYRVLRQICHQVQEFEVQKGDTLCTIHISLFDWLILSEEIKL